MGMLGQNGLNIISQSRTAKPPTPMTASAVGFSRVSVASIAI